MGSGVVGFVAAADGKASIVAGVTEDLTSRISAVDLVRVAAEALGGKGGGGRPDMAQAGGPGQWRPVSSPGCDRKKLGELAPVLKSPALARLPEFIVSATLHAGGDSGLSNNIRQQPIVDFGDLVFQLKLALFQPRQRQKVGIA